VPPPASLASGLAPRARTPVAARFDQAARGATPPPAPVTAPELGAVATVPAPAPERAAAAAAPAAII